MPGLLGGEKPRSISTLPGKTPRIREFHQVVHTPGPCSPVTGCYRAPSHSHQAHQPQGGLWQLGDRPSADLGPGGPPTPAVCCAAGRGAGAKLLCPTRGPVGPTLYQVLRPGKKTAPGAMDPPEGPQRTENSTELAISSLSKQVNALAERQKPCRILTSRRRVSGRHPNHSSLW